ELGEQPVTVAFSPDGRYAFVTHFADDWVAVLDPKDGRLIKRIEVGRQGANVSFRPDGAYGYVAVTGRTRSRWWRWSRWRWRNASRSAKAPWA
ncbi:MAG: hypothetical protein M3Q60_22810, partial [Actinomycetota bacterium]|nr:hypothetical protein [Actinomycetota bacterium]